MKTKQQTDCNHTQRERELDGIWHTRELRLAIRKGYRIVKVLLVNNYTNSSKSLFKKYVDLFLKIKEEASGFPQNITTDTEKDKYIKDYFDNTGIKLK